MSGLASYIRRIPAGGRTKIEARGTTIILRVSSANMDVIARSQVGQGAKDGQAYKITMRPAERWYAPTEFSQVEIRNADAFNAQTVEFLIGYGDYIGPDPRVHADRVAALVTVIPAGFPFTEIVAPINANVWRTTIKNRLFNCTTGAVLNPTSFIVGPSVDGLGTCNGHELSPGESITIWSKIGGLEPLIAFAGTATPVGTTVPHIGILQEVFEVA